jgi:hypothetical protein
MRWKTTIVLMTVALLAAPALHADEESPDWEAIAERVVRQMALGPGEKVLLVSHPGSSEELVLHLRYAVMEAGGIDLGVREVMPFRFVSHRDREVMQVHRQRSRKAMRELFREANVMVVLPGTAGHPEYGAVTDALGGDRRVVHFHWEGSARFSSATPAPGHPPPSREVLDATYERAVLEADYPLIAATQRQFAAALGRGKARVTTPLGTDLRFWVGARPVTRQDGDASAERARRAAVIIDREVELPCGAVRVAPLEDSVEGVIAFPASTWDGEEVRGLKLRFEKGVVVEVTAEAGRGAVERELDAGGEAARSFREFALGFNPELAVPADSPWIPYYGYGAGVVRLSLGDNSELGGRVRGDYVRWNFFLDATVEVDGQIWVRDGQLAPPTPTSTPS